jgi:sugar (pentulose or hexulose) kinase
MSRTYSIGLDYGTNSVRCLIVDIRTGREVGNDVWGYAHGKDGVILSRDPNLARQHPADYLEGRKEQFAEPLKTPGGVFPVSIRSRSSALAWTRPGARHSPWTSKVSPWH